MGIYDFSAKAMGGREIHLSQYEGKVLLIANTASKCGFTPQYEGLQELHGEYSDKGLVILGFPSNQFAGQEPGSNDEIQDFCRLNYGVDFTMFEKVEVRGDDAHPIFGYLTSQAPFKGFDTEHPIGNKLQEALEQNFPEFLVGDSIKWNFTKFLIDRQGNVVGRYEPTTLPSRMKEDIEKLL